MKSVKEALLERRSIRRYERQHIADADMELIHQAIRNTPTSYNGQQFSVIDITDADTKLKLYELVGEKQIKTCDHFLVFLADYHKMELLGRQKGVDADVKDFCQTLDGVAVGMLDASLALMSALAMGEALGLGTCCIGHIRNAHQAEVAKLLGLPQLTFVVCGLALGIPREMPDMKPKQPMELVVHRNAYAADTDMLPRLADYDNEIRAYNATRSGTTTANDWCAHIAGYYAEGTTFDMLAYVRAQGFDAKK